MYTIQYIKITDKTSSTVFGLLSPFCEADSRACVLPRSPLSLSPSFLVHSFLIFFVHDRLEWNKISERTKNKKLRTANVQSYDDDDDDDDDVKSQETIVLKCYTKYENRQERKRTKWNI